MRHRARCAEMTPKFPVDSRESHVIHSQVLDTLRPQLVVTPSHLFEEKQERVGAAQRPHHFASESNREGGIPVPYNHDLAGIYSQKFRVLRPHYST